MEVERSRKPANLEFVALAATVLIWLGAFFLGVGLVLAYIDLKTQLEIQAVLASSSPSEPVVLAVTMEPTEPPLPPTVRLSAHDEAPTVIPLRQTPTPTRAEQTVYVVQGGDSLWKIAESYGITVDDLVAANGISKDDVIHPGQELVIPAPGQALTPLPRSPTHTPIPLPATPTAVPPTSALAPRRLLHPHAHPRPPLRRTASWPWPSAWTPRWCR